MSTSRKSAFLFRVALVAALVVVTSGRANHQATTSAKQPTPSQIDALFNSISDSRSPGLAVLVRKNAQTVFEHGYGVRDLRTFTKIDPETNFRLASCTKQFTAMAVMLLVHDGKLRYDEKIVEIFPNFPAYGATITIRNLLNHTSGLPDYEDLMDLVSSKAGHPLWTETKQIQDAEVLELLKKESHPKFAAGTKWAYSNSGYVLLGLIVAKTSGKSLGDFLHERIFAPLCMDHTLVYVKGENDVTNGAFGHTKTGDAFKETDQSSTSATQGDGGVYSSLRDQAKWDDALTRHTLLSEKEMDPSLTGATLADGSQPKWPAGQDRPEGTAAMYGFGWFLDPYRGHARMWHYGDTSGFHTYVVRFVNDKLSVIVLCNRTDLDPESLALKVADLYFAPHS